MSNMREEYGCRRISARFTSEGYRRAANTLTRVGWQSTSGWSVYRVSIQRRVKCVERKKSSCTLFAPPAVGSLPATDNNLQPPLPTTKHFALTSN